MKRRTVAASRRSCHSFASARWRSCGMLGQSGLSRMKVAKRSNPAALSESRNSTHSTSFRAMLADVASAIASLDLC